MSDITIRNSIPTTAKSMAMTTTGVSSLASVGAVCGIAAQELICSDLSAGAANAAFTHGFHFLGTVGGACIPVGSFIVAMLVLVTARKFFSSPPSNPPQVPTIPRVETPQKILKPKESNKVESTTEELLDLLRLDIENKSLKEAYGLKPFENLEEAISFLRSNLEFAFRDFVSTEFPPGSDLTNLQTIRAVLLELQTTPPKAPEEVTHFTPAKKEQYENQQKELIESLITQIDVRLNQETQEHDSSYLEKRIAFLTVQIQTLEGLVILPPETLQIQQEAIQEEVERSKVKQDDLTDDLDQISYLFRKLSPEDVDTQEDVDIKARKTALREKKLSTEAKIEQFNIQMETAESLCQTISEIIENKQKVMDRLIEYKTELARLSQNLEELDHIHNQSLTGKFERLTESLVDAITHPNQILEIFRPITPTTVQAPSPTAVFEVDSIVLPAPLPDEKPLYTTKEEQQRLMNTIDNLVAAAVEVEDPSEIQMKIAELSQYLQ